MHETKNKELGGRGECSSITRMYSYRIFQETTMFRNTYSILYFVRKSKKDKSLGTIYARLTFNKQVVTLCSMNIQVPCKDFNTKRQTLKDQTLNSKLSQFKSDVIKLIELTPDPDAYKIRDIISGKSKMYYSIIDIIEMYVTEHRIKLADNTIRDLAAKGRKLKVWLSLERKDEQKQQARFFDNKTFLAFKSWLIHTQNNTENSANKYGIKIRRCLDWAVEMGYLNSNPLTCKMPMKHDKDLTHLKWEWVEKLRAYKFDGKLKKAVDMYVFSCCTGICHADMLNLRSEHLDNDSRLGLTITNKRQKVKSIYCTPLWGFAREIYEEFGSLEAIPKISNQKVNDYIKLALIKIDYPQAAEITFHTARKSFVNYCLNDRRIEPHIIMTFTGHKDIDEIQAYGEVNKNTAISTFYK